MFKVRVVSYSKPAIGVELKDDLLQMVAYCARVSNPNNQNNEETAEKLVKYLIKHQIFMITQSTYSHFPG